MNGFHYSQARLQARYASRLDEEAWRRLLSIGDFAIFLKQARETGMARWLQGIAATATAEEVDRAMRLRLREHVAEVAAWHPAPWRPAMRWIATVVDLASLAHLAAGHPPAPWMCKDPVLAPLCTGATWAGFAPLVHRWRQGEPPAAAWLNHWQSLWPAGCRQDRRLLTLLTILREAGQALNRCTGLQETQPVRNQLVHHLENHFRRTLFHPATAFTHLALVVLDLERLRGALCRRLLFPEATP